MAEEETYSEQPVSHTHCQVVLPKNVVAGHEHLLWFESCALPHLPGNRYTYF